MVVGILNDWPTYSSMAIFQRVVLFSVNLLVNIVISSFGVSMEDNYYLWHITGTIRVVIVSFNKKNNYSHNNRKHYFAEYPFMYSGIII